MSHVLSSKYGGKLGEGFSKQEKLDSIEFKPQHSAKKGQSRSGWLSDLISLRKVIILCGFCRPKFNPRRFGYRRVFIPDATGKSDGYTVNGVCDWCAQETAQMSGGTAFQPEELYAQTHIDPTVARRKARIIAKSFGTWNYINKNRR